MAPTSYSYFFVCVYFYFIAFNPSGDEKNIITIIIVIDVVVVFLN